MRVTVEVQDRVVRPAHRPGSEAEPPIRPEQSRGRLHAIHPAGPGHEGAASAFALGLLLALGRASGPWLWVQDRQATREAGLPYGPGLGAAGLDPDRLVVVMAANAMEALGAAEIGLETPGLAGVLVELPRRLPADMLRPGKRLSLRAEARGAPCLLLHATPEPVQSPVATRWSIASRPQGEGFDVAPAAAMVEAVLEKNRFGPLGRWSLTWDPLISSFLSTTKAARDADRAGDGREGLSVLASR